MTEHVEEIVEINDINVDKATNFVRYRGFDGRAQLPSVSSCEIIDDVIYFFAS